MDKETYQSHIKFEAQNSLGLSFKLPVAASVESYDALAGRSDAVLESANSNVTYRSTLPNIRARFAELLEEETGIARKTKEVPGKSEDDEPKEVYDESENVYFKRVLSETGNADNPAAFQHIADKVSAEVEEGGFTDDDGKFIELRFDPSGRQTSSGPRKRRIAKSYLEKAQQIIDAGKGEKWAEVWGEKLGFTIEPTVEGIGGAIAENERRKREAAKAEYDEV